MKILVTGGAGFIGSVLIPMLLDKGYKVLLYDNFTWGMKPILHFAAHKNLELISGDVRDNSKIADALTGCDFILHLAAIVGYPACAANPYAAKTVNIEGTANITENMSPAQNIIFASTGSTYGKVDGICTEESPINPLTLYGSTKWEAEKLIIAKNGISLRFATAFGVSPRFRLDLLPNDFVYQALHNKQIVLYEGHFKRTFIQVNDAARAYLFAIENFDAMQGQAYNIGSETMNFTKKEIALEIQQLVDFYLHEADAGADLDKRDYEVSFSKIRNLGFETEIDLIQGIAELVKVLTHLQIHDDFRNI